MCEKTQTNKMSYKNIYSLKQIHGNETELKLQMANVKNTTTPNHLFKKRAHVWCGGGY